jgi:hypothetical protein
MGVSLQLPGPLPPGHVSRRPERLCTPALLRRKRSPLVLILLFDIPIEEEERKDGLEAIRGSRTDPVEFDRVEPMDFRDADGPGTTHHQHRAAVAHSKPDTGDTLGPLGLAAREPTETRRGSLPCMGRRHAAKLVWRTGAHLHSNRRHRRPTLVLIEEETEE